MGSSPFWCVAHLLPVGVVSHLPLHRLLSAPGALEKAAFALYPSAHVEGSANGPLSSRGGCRSVVEFLPNLH